MSSLIESAVRSHVSLPMAQEALSQARLIAQGDGLPYAGQVSPGVAWVLFAMGLATLVDIRTPEERAFVGEVPGALAVPWATGIAMTRNPRFARDLAARCGKQAVVLLLSRSGHRSADAAAAATKAGMTNVFSIREGLRGSWTTRDIVTN